MRMPASPSFTPEKTRRSTNSWRCAGALCLLSLGTWMVFKQFHHDRAGAGGRDEELIRSMVASEELILELTPTLDRLATGVKNLGLPTTETRASFFADEVEVTDLAENAAESERGTAPVLAAKRVFPISPSATRVASGDLALWRSLLDGVSYFEYASFRFVKGELTDPDFKMFRGTVVFKGLAKRAQGGWMSLSGKMHVDWAHTSEGWRITAWTMDKMEGRLGEQLLFSEALDRALPGEGDLYRARRSIHQEETVLYYKAMKGRAPSYDFSPTAMNQKPAVSVVDVDGDGFDDIYLMERLGNNLLLRNRGDGTFEESAEKFELAFPGQTTCSLFADFDNDGDPDLLLGRALERCVYLENVGGWFREVEQTIALPNLAVSLAAADYNGDGLLDIYVSTYRPGDMGTGLGIESGGSGKPWPDRFLSTGDAEEFRRRFTESKSGAVAHKGFLDQAGPPNALLANTGGGQFKPAPESVALAGWKNTLQATWCDYDDDGDADLYVANDWAPDHLFRNDGKAGFADVTEEAGTTIFGFAMGASWGDYDNDGKQDLYVSNMYSKAGRRIMAQMDGLDSSLVISAEGNYLYRQGEGGKFEHVSGLEPPALLVADSGWSWGGQFVDFDNDADLDIYALSGYFSAPDEVASEVDL